MRILIFILLDSTLEGTRFCTEWSQAFPYLNLLLISSWIEVWFIRFVPKYMNCSTLSNELLSIPILWLCPAFWSQNMTTYPHKILGMSEKLILSYNANGLHNIQPFWTTEPPINHAPEHSSCWMSFTAYKSVCGRNLKSGFLCRLTYHISWPIRCIFFPEKGDLNSTCVLCVEGKYYFQTCKYPYPHQVKTTTNMILVAVTTIFWVSMMNKLYYGC